MSVIFEIIYWVKIFLSPNFFAILLFFILTSAFGPSNWYFTLFIPSIVLGIWLAERARKKYGTTIYDAKIMNTPDITETWEIDGKSQRRNTEREHKT